MNGIARITATLVRYSLLEPGQTVVVAVSGGPDSTLLLHALALLGSEWSLRLTVAHLHHGLRGAEADEDADYVAEMARSLGLPLRMERADVSGMRTRRRLSSQQAAREARRAFLLRIAAEIGADRVAVGHTRDDRVETVLLNLLRGAGLEGLAGFPPAALPFIRPLYDLGREDVETECARLRLLPRRDSSNLGVHYRRNRVRQELLPYLRAYFNLKTDAAILRAAELAAADHAALESLAAVWLPQVTELRTEEECALSAQALRALPLGLQRRVVRLAIAQMRGNLVHIAFDSVECALDALREGKQYGACLPSAGQPPLSLHCADGLLHIRKEPAPASLLSWSFTLAVPGQTDIRVAHVSVEVVDSPALPAAELFSQADGNVYVFDRQNLVLPLCVRSWQPGDRICLPNLEGRKKLQDLFVDARIPSKRRRMMPVLADAAGRGSILAVLGVRAGAMALTAQEYAAALLAGEGASGLIAITVHAWQETSDAPDAFPE